MRAALDVAGDRTVVLDAQSHLVDWYAGFGFAPSGRGFLEDGDPAHADAGASGRG